MFKNLARPSRPASLQALVCFFLLICLPATAQTLAPVPGDVNGDLYVSTADVVLALRFLVGSSVPSETQLKACDLNRNGAVDLADINRILRNAAGLRPSDRFVPRSIKVGAATRKYAVYIPPEYNGLQEWPLIIFLNGAGECGTDGNLQTTVGLGPAIKRKMAEWPFIVLFPQKPNVADGWDRYDDMVMAQLEQTKSEYRVDASRIYLTGLSQGGYGTWAIAAKHPDLFAAIAPICGWGDAAWAPALKSIPIWCFHGDADPTVPVSASIAMVNAVKAAGGDPKLTIYKGMGHNVWDRAYQQEDLAAWFLEHKLPKQ
ncbi:MAG: prolyl oligopeptidase family serine peptidase [Armatimonadota bacterium]